MTKEDQGKEPMELFAVRIPASKMRKLDELLASLEEQVKGPFKVRKSDLQRQIVEKGLEAVLSEYIPADDGEV